MPEKPRQAHEDVRGYLSRAKPLLSEAGISLVVRDSAWMRSGGAKASEYKMSEEKIDEHATRMRQYRGGMLAEIGIGDLLRIRLHIGGGKESELRFELRDHNGNIEVLGDSTNIEILDRMIEKLQVMVAVKIKAALRMRLAFHLME